MAFDNIDVISLRNSLNQCKKTLDHSDSDGLVESISNESVWQSSAKDTLKNALCKLNNRYVDLEKKIDEYLEVVNNIEKYKNLEKEVSDLKVKYQNLSQNLYYTEIYTEKVSLIDGTVREDKKTRTVKDEKIEKELSNIDNDIKDKINEMEKLNDKVIKAI